MSRSFKFFFIFIGCFLFSAISPIFKNNVNASKFLKVELNKELKKGNLLIGLKQHLGGKNDDFSKNNALSILNIVLSSFFVLSLNLNVFGVALGTLIASYITATVFSFFTYLLVPVLMIAKGKKTVN